MWGYDEYAKVGDVGFLVEHSNVLHPRTPSAYHLTEHPAHTNMSHAPRLTGWCGTTNDIYIYAHGIGRVARTCRNGRVQYTRVTDPTEVARVLDSLGYPELE